MVKYKLNLPIMQLKQVDDLAIQVEYAIVGKGKGKKKKKKKTLVS
jgi:hypothetical protein